MASRTQGGVSLSLLWLFILVTAPFLLSSCGILRILAGKEPVESSPPALHSPAVTQPAAQSAAAHADLPTAALAESVEAVQAAAQSAAAPSLSQNIKLAPAMPDRLMLPSIKIDVPVVEIGWANAQKDDGRIFSQWEVADSAGGWHKNSAFPGQGSNVVISGHNNIYGAIFRKLDQLKQGDLAVIWSKGRRYEYRIAQVLIVPEKQATPEQRRENVRYIEPTTEERLTLVSCWPRNDNSHRIIVIAFPLEDKAS